jgi:cyanophycinase
MSAVVLALTLSQAPLERLCAEEALPAAETLGPAAPVTGTLFICGGGKIPDDILAKFVEIAGGPKANLVIITTASETADTADVDSRLEIWRKLRPGTLTVLHTRDKEVADDPRFSEPLESATGVWFIGGHQQRLTDAYLGTRTEKAIKGVLKRGGIVGGTSAGAAIMSPVMILGGGINLAGGGISEIEIGHGFGFLQGTLVDQHFLKRKRQDRLVEALSKYPRLVGIGVDENTVLVVQGRRISVLGDSSVEIWQPAVGDKPAKSRTLLKDMEEDLVALYRAALARVKPRFQFDKEKVETRPSGGTLVIAGGGEVPEAAAEKFVEAAGGEDAPIVVVTTANGDRPAHDAPSVAWLAEAGAKNIHFVHPRTKTEAEDPALLSLLRKAGGVWFVGGRQWRLVDTFEDTAAEVEFHAVLARGGVIGGTGGGASMLSDYLVRGNPLSNRDIMAQGYEEGFGFLTGVAIDPFFTKRNRFADMARLKRAHPGLVGLGVDEDTALVIKDHAFEVLGKNHVVVYGHHEPGEADKNIEFLFEGDRYDLASRQRLGPPRNTDSETPTVPVIAENDDDPEPQPPLACDE